jgi:hypothetical protein
MQLLPDRSKDFVFPDLAINISNRNEGGKIVKEISFIDISFGIPNTTSVLKKVASPRPIDVENAVREANIPILRVGHANSFIKNISLSHITDENMRAALIERMHRDRLNNIRSRVPDSQGLQGEPTNPLILPLRGKMTVLGHINWKPFRSFYLDAGIYIVDGVYKILGVTHKLSAEGFESEVDIMFH